LVRIEIAKRPDGTGLLRCTRPDGSVTWQKQAKHAAHFALHDLTHYAVETALHYRRGFFGLLSEGWNVEDTGGKGARGPVPAEAVEVDRIVGLFDIERASGVLWTTEEFNSYSPRVLTEQDIHRIRSLRASLFRQWSAILPGQNLELTFDVHLPQAK
jgi:hypothetical protein